MNHKSTVWAHTLFKNEERWLWYSVSSVINYVDKLLLWDTGSSDKSWLIAQKLKEKYKDKIELKQYGEVTTETFYKVRQAMLDETDSDWFIVVDADEVWWEESIKNLTSKIQNEKEAESFVVSTMNVVGDLYHHMPSEAGNYKFGNKVGNYNLRAIKRSIPGLHSEGLHGVWGWADDKGQQIQDRGTFKVIDSMYLHTTFLPRGESRVDDLIVPKREKKLKYEIGMKLPLDFYFPESMFLPKPDFIPSPWSVMRLTFKLKALFQTPLKKIKRRFINAGVGY